MVNNESVVTTEVVVEPKKEETIEMGNRKIVYRFIKRIIDIIPSSIIPMVFKNLVSFSF